VRQTVGLNAVLVPVQLAAERYNSVPDALPPETETLGVVPVKVASPAVLTTAEETPGAIEKLGAARIPGWPIESAALFVPAQKPGAPIPQSLK
jgi:hypothetical protein